MLAPPYIAHGGVLYIKNVFSHDMYKNLRILTVMTMLFQAVVVSWCVWTKKVTSHFRRERRMRPKLHARPPTRPLLGVAAVFGVLVVLLAAVAAAGSFASAARARRAAEGFAGDGNGGPPPVCGLISSQFEPACEGDANVQRRLFFGDPSMNTVYDWENNSSDSYYLGKVVDGPDRSSLRMTINDNADESFQIWGDACATGDCGGAGALAHKFRADGSAAVAGSLVVGSPDALTAADRGWSGGSYAKGGSLNIYNRHAGNWTHFPWFDGKNYIRNATQVDGTLGVDGTVNVGGGAQVCVGGVCVSSGALKKVLAMATEYKGRMASVEQRNARQEGRLAALGGGADRRDDAFGAAKSEFNTVRGAADALFGADMRLFVGSPASVLGPYDMGPWQASNFRDRSAQWIWNDPDAAGGAAQGACIVFNRAYTARTAVDATMDIVVDNQATVYLNGARVGQAAGGWEGGDYPKLALRLKRGANIIDVEAVNAGGPAGLLVSVRDGAGAVLLRSDASWKWSDQCRPASAVAAPTPAAPPPPAPPPMNMVPDSGRYASVTQGEARHGYAIDGFSYKMAFQGVSPNDCFWKNSDLGGDGYDTGEFVQGGPGADEKTPGTCTVYWATKGAAVNAGATAVKPGNNGSVSCDTYCAGAWAQGPMGACVGAVDSATGAIACGDAINFRTGSAHDVSCECLLEPGAKPGGAKKVVRGTVTAFPDPDFGGAGTTWSLNDSGLARDVPGKEMSQNGLGIGDGQHGGPRSFRVSPGVKLTIYDNAGQSASFTADVPNLYFQKPRNDWHWDNCVAAFRVESTLQVTAFSQPDYAGVSVAVSPVGKTFTYLDLIEAGVGIGDGQSGGPRSFRVPAGLTLTVYDGGGGDGQSATFVSDVPNLRIQKPMNDWHWDNSVASIRVDAR